MYSPVHRPLFRSEAGTTCTGAVSCLYRRMSATYINTLIYNCLFLCLVFHQWLCGVADTVLHDQVLYRGSLRSYLVVDIGVRVCGCYDALEVGLRGEPSG